MLPVLVLIALGLTWLLSLGVSQVRAVDAARETARALARDEPEAAAVALGRRVAPEGSRIEVHEGSDEVRVRVQVEVQGPGRVFAFVPGVDVTAEAVAAREPR